MPLLKAKQGQEPGASKAVLRAQLSDEFVIRPLFYTYQIAFKTFLICLLVAGCFGISSANILSQQPAQPLDSLTVRTFQQQNLDKYLSDEDYRYDREFRPAAPSLWERFKQWLFDRLFYAMGDENTSNLLRWVIYLSCGAVILYVILKLTNTSIRGIIYGQAQNGRMVLSESEENIHQLDFDQLIKESVNARQYKRAIRLLYLKTLKKLTDQGLIDWRINKTNQDYMQELSRTDIAPAFGRLTLLFEYFCYGDFSIYESDFEAAGAQFKVFEEQLQKITPPKAVSTR
jgi:hypothetical protein